MVSASLLATLFTLAPLALAPPAAAPAPVSDSVPADDDYAAAVARVRQAQNMANEDTELGATQLRDALQLLQSFGPQLAKDPEGQSARTMAQLTLARALLAIGDADGARATMDDAIRISRGDPLPTGEFGPGLVALHRERARVLEKAGTATIDVDCKSPCRVYINERPSDPRSEDLVLGRYRVWIESTDGSERPIQISVTLEQPDQITTMTYGSAPIDDPPEVKPFKRIMPRGVEIALLVAGVAAIGVGGSLLAIDNHCPGSLANPRTTECPMVYVTRTAGLVTLAAGGAFGLLGGITLAVDEVRLGKQRGQQVALTWTLRF